MFDVCATAHIDMIFNFPMAVNNSLKVGPLVFLL